MEKEFGGASTVRGTYKAGDFYGETPILLDSPTIASLRATESSRLIRLDRNQFKELIDSSSECTNLVVQTMTKRLTAIRDYMRETNPLRVQVVGSQYSEECRDVRAFLTLNRIPYEWVDGDREPERVPLVASPNSTGAFAIVDNAVLVREPLTARKVAEALGISTRPKSAKYDVVIVGGGPAGLGAAVYGASEGLCILLLERNATGGQAGTSSRIENYLGFPNGIAGDELASRALKQDMRFGSEIVMTREVEAISPVFSGYAVKLEGDMQVETKAVVLATGVNWRRLQADGIDRLIGKGALWSRENRSSHDCRKEGFYRRRWQLRRPGCDVFLKLCEFRDDARAWARPRMLNIPVPHRSVGATPQYYHRVADSSAICGR